MNQAAAFVHHAQYYALGPRCPAARRLKTVSMTRSRKHVTCLVCLRMIAADVKRKRAAASKPMQEYCDGCDGCGWFEGGETLKTTCKKCNGTGLIERSRPRRGGRK